MPTGAHSSRLRRNVVANMVGRAASAVLWIAATPFVLHGLGAERFAVWALFFVLNGYVLTLDFGAHGVSRFLAAVSARGNRFEARRVLLRSVTLSFGLGLMWAAVCLLSRGLFLDFFHIPAALQGEVRTSLAVFALSLMLFMISQVLLGGLVGLQRLDLSNLYMLIGLSVHLAVVMAAVSRGYGLVGAAAGAVAGHMTTSVLSALSLRAGLARMPEGDHPDRFSWRDLLSYGIMLQAANVLGVSQMQAGKVLLGTLGQLVWVTQYELGFRVTNALWALSTLIQGAVVPAAAHAVEVGGTAEARKLYEWCCRWVVSVGAYVLGLVGAAAPAIFTLWLGSPHPDTISVARWIAVGFAFSTLVGPLTAIARGIGSPWYEALNFAIALAVNVGAAVFLIPRYGANGAGMAMAISFLVATIVLVTLFHRRIGIATGPWLSRIAVPRLLPAAAAAIGVGLLGDRWRLDSRTEAFFAAAAEGTLYTLIFVAATWPTGDAKTLLLKGRVWLGRAAQSMGRNPGTEHRQDS